MARDKKVWEPMKLTYAGDVGDIIKNAGGQGKSAVKRRLRRHPQTAGTGLSQQRSIHS